jgi:tetratricopeptide (TPR) repeat protein
MPHPYLRLLRNTFLAGSLAATVNSAWGYQQPSANAADSSVIKQGPSAKASAYYHYSLGHMYEEMAEALGNKAEYLNKAIDNYRLAMQEDPSASFLVEDIAELYRASGRIREAVLEAEQAIKTNPNDLNARRVLARIYTQQIGDSSASRIDEGMVKRAIEQYKFIADKKALEADPDNEDALTGLAMVYADLGDSKRATELLEKLSAKNPSPRALIALASSYEQIHEYALAAGAYRRALDLDPTRAEIKQQLAQDLAISEQFDEALKLYQELATENPRDPQAELRISQIYRQQRKYDLARQALDKASELSPDDLEIKLSESLLLEDEGKLSEAIVELKQIIDATAKKTYSKAERDYRAGLLERLGTLYRNLEQYDQAADAFRQIETLDPDVASRAEAQIIDTYRLGKDFAKAQQLSDAAAKKYPNDRTLLAVRASLLADLGRADEAAAELKKTLGGKDDRETYLTLAQVYDKAHNYAEMAKALDAAEKLSTSKEDKVTVYFMRGAMYERQKKLDLAEKQFREVLVLDPQNGSALNYLGYMFADENVRLQEAQDLIEKAVAVEPNNGAFLDSLGWVYYRQNKLKEAEEQLNRSLQMISKDPTIHDHLGDVYFKQGKLKEAIAQWQASLAEWNSSAPSDREPDDVAKVQKKLDGARVRLAKEQGPAPRSNNN